MRLNPLKPAVLVMMQSFQKLKDLRDALWQATIETKIRFGEESVDPYSRPLPDIVTRLEQRRILTTSDALLIAAFLRDYDLDDPSQLHKAISDDTDTELSRIIALLRSVRES